jgi:uridine kinase
VTRPFVVAVAGGSGSGKSTVARAVVTALGDDRASIIKHDAYYRDRSDVPPAERNAINFDHPEALDTALLVEHLEALRAERPVEIPVYDFTTHTRGAETRTVTPPPVIVLDGILILADAHVRALIDLGVFVDTPADLRFIRRLKRDIKKRGRTPESVITQYLATVRPMHEAFVEPSRAFAQVVITEGGHNRVAIDQLVDRIRAALPEL